MPGTFCKPVRVAAVGVRKVTTKPMGLIAGAYQKWQLRRLETKRIDSECESIAAAANERLEQFHDAVWREWPQHVNQRIRGEEPHDEPY